MIFTRLTGLTAYRMHTPKWAVAPTSGAGAALHGGRANRPGVAALYLSLEAQTAIDEYQQVSPLLPPGTMVSYQVTVDSVLDFGAGNDPAQWSALWEEFFCDWRELWFNQHIEPPSWVLGDEAIAAGAKGILFTSQARRGGTNLMLYTDFLGAADLIKVYDPAHALPRNQQSWD
jgi:RES domain-containing protein